MPQFSRQQFQIVGNVDFQRDRFVLGGRYRKVSDSRPQPKDSEQFWIRQLLKVGHRGISDGDYRIAILVGDALFECQDSALANHDRESRVA